MPSCGTFAIFFKSVNFVKPRPFSEHLHYGPKKHGNSVHCLYTSYFGECSTTSGNFWHTNSSHTITIKHTTCSIYVTNSTVCAVTMSIRTMSILWVKCANANIQKKNNNPPSKLVKTKYDVILPLRKACWEHTLSRGHFGFKGTGPAVSLSSR
jgi:hypothetical protein